jgi:hypothetical protein
VAGEDHSHELEQVNETIARLRRESDAGLIVSAEDERVYVERMKALIERRTQLEGMPRRAAGWITEETGQIYREAWADSDHRQLLLESGIKFLLDAPPIPLVDAWLSESDFDELLFLGGRSAARGPAPGEPTRCLLFPNLLSIQQMGSFAFRKKQRLMRSLWQPQLFIDLDNDAPCDRPEQRGQCLGLGFAGDRDTGYLPALRRACVPVGPERRERCCGPVLFDDAGRGRVRSRHATTDHRMSQLRRAQAAVFVVRQCAHNQCPLPMRSRRPTG